MCYGRRQKFKNVDYRKKKQKVEIGKDKFSKERKKEENDS